MSDCSAHGLNCGCPVAADAEAEHWASAQHAIWSHWMHWFFAHDTPENRERWKRQMDMPYAALSHREKQSDRDVVTQFLAPLIEPLKARAEAAEAALAEQQYHHAACLSIAEGAPGWQEFDAKYPAAQAVKAARAEVERLQAAWRSDAQQEMERDADAWQHLLSTMREAGYTDQSPEWLVSEVERLKAENVTFRAAQKACEDCDAPTMAEVADLKRVYAEVVAHYQHQFPDRPFEAGPDDQRIAMLLAKLTYEVERLKAEVERLARENADHAESRDNLIAVLQETTDREVEARRLLEELLDVLSRYRGPYEPLAAAPARYRTLTDAERAARAFLAGVGK